MSYEAPKSRRPHLAARLAAIAAAAVLSMSVSVRPAMGAVAGAVNQDPSRLVALAKSAALRQLAPLGARERLTVGPIAPGLRLASCGRAIDAGPAPGLHTHTQVVVELRCTGATPWHIYVPVRVVGVTPVALAAHALVAGTVLTAKDVHIEVRDLTQLPPGYLDDPAIAVGLTAARPIAEGTVLTNQLLLGTPAVRRGQTVTLVADAGGISVRMSGRALADGFVNQRVKVENLSSGKIVEGVARSDQTVEILLP